ncbi:putative disease resistance protein RGA1 [Pistacia vera]|uniref:putative disease resistance protein RGA1 n=1 Tax=Pistacia vera TaxID=55513 RepID=UPI001263C68B|nr:putative disease resistance protein RGA1 [Pistacia vera]
MAEALVSVVLEQLASIARQQLDQQLMLVAGVDDQVRKLTSHFRSIRVVLEDAENRQFMDSGVRDWLDKLKEASYDIDDVLDEWNTSIGKLQLTELRNASKSMIKKLASIARQQLDQQLMLVAGVDDQVRKLTSHFRSIRVVLEDAENRQFMDSGVRDPNLIN